MNIGQFLWLLFSIFINKIIKIRAKLYPQVKSLKFNSKGQEFLQYNLLDLFLCCLCIRFNTKNWSFYKYFNYMPFT